MQALPICLELKGEVLSLARCLKLVIEILYTYSMYGVLQSRRIVVWRETGGSSVIDLQVRRAEQLSGQ